MVSVILVTLTLLVRYAHVSIPVVSAHVFETLLIGYLVLLVGNLFNRRYSELGTVAQRAVFERSALLRVTWSP